MTNADIWCGSEAFTQASSSQQGTWPGREVLWGTEAGAEAWGLTSRAMEKALGGLSRVSQVHYCPWALEPS